LYDLCIPHLQSGLIFYISWLYYVQTPHNERKKTPMQVHVPLKQKFEALEVELDALIRVRNIADDLGALDEQISSTIKERAKEIVKTILGTGDEQTADAEPDTPKRQVYRILIDESDPNPLKSIEFALVRYLGQGNGVIPSTIEIDRG